MKTHRSHKKSVGMTLFEVLAVITIGLVVVALLLPALAATRRKSSKISCVNNLKQVGLAFRIWEGDNNDKYPMAVSVTNGGAMELIATGNITACFQAMSNELSTPKILFCWQDTAHTFATNFEAGFTSQNISYFIGADAVETNAPMFLAGDASLEINGSPVKSGMLEFSTNALITWSVSRHKFGGNVALVDGSVQQFSQSGLQTAIMQASVATNRLVIP